MSRRAVWMSAGIAFHAGGCGIDRAPTIETNELPPRLASAHERLERKGVEVEARLFGTKQRPVLVVNGDSNPALISQGEGLGDYPLTNSDLGTREPIDLSHLFMCGDFRIAGGSDEAIADARRASEVCRGGR